MIYIFSIGPVISFDQEVSTITFDKLPSIFSTTIGGIYLGKHLAATPLSEDPPVGKKGKKKSGNVSVFSYPARHRQLNWDPENIYICTLQRASRESESNRQFFSLSYDTQAYYGLHWTSSVSIWPRHASIILIVIQWPRKLTKCRPNPTHYQLSSNSDTFSVVCIITYPRQRWSWPH